VSLVFSFCRSSALPPLPAEALDSWSKDWPQIHREGEHDFAYANRFTGVAFTLRLVGPPVHAPVLPEGLTDAGLHACLEVDRPSFFGREAAPVLQHLAQRLELWGLDPGSSSPAPEFVTADWVYRTWSRARSGLAMPDSRSASLRQYTAREEQAVAFWEYMYGYPGFAERSARAGFFAPRMFLMARNGQREVQTAVTLIPDAAQVLPPADLAMVVQDRTRFFRVRKEVDVFYAPMADIVQCLSPWLIRFESRPEMLMLRREDAAEAFARLARFRFPWTRRDFTTVAPDAFLDLPSLASRVA
jgi:hypothetical protein